MGRSRQCNYVGAFNRPPDFTHGRDLWGQLVAAQKSHVLVLRVDRFHDVGFVRPKRNLVSVPREKISQRGTPRPGPHDCAAHQDAASFFTKRCSSPRRSRPMFVRCVQNTNSAMITLATKTGERGSRYRARIAIGSTTAPRRDARLT